MTRRGVGAGVPSGARARAVLRALALCAGASLPGCSGEAFHLVDSAALGAGGDASTFPPLVTDSTRHDDGPEPLGSSGSSGSSGTSGTSGASGSGNSEPDADTTPLPTQPATPCGAVRVADASLADDEVCVPAGTFNMGSSEATKAGYFAHGPVHAVTLSAFFLDAFEVTVARYRRCVDELACSAPSTSAAQGCTYTLAAADHEQHPITCVPWTSAQSFCAWDGGRHLPSEAQWEQAARDAAGSKYPWGDAFSCERAVLAGASQCTQYGGQLPQPVGSARAGASLELAHDLTGNAEEWVADWFGGYPTTAVSDPTGPATGSSRIQRGGGWLTAAADATSYARRGGAPDAIGPLTFRCARDAD